MLYHRNVNPSLADLGRPLIVLAQTSASTQPSKGTLNDPTLGDDHEPFGTRRTLHDLQNSQAVGPDPADQAVADVDAVGIDRPQATKAATDFGEDLFGSIIVLDIRRRHHDG